MCDNDVYLDALHRDKPVATVRPPGDEAGLRAALTEIGSDYTTLRSAMKGIALDSTVTTLANACAVAARVVAETHDWLEFDRAALSQPVQEEEPGLDVERLAVAICAHREPLVDATPDMFTDDECRMWARRVAAEYARLAKPDSGS